MWNVLEQPWTLTVVAAITLLVLLFVRPSRKRLYLWLLPFAIAGFAFALDHLIQTDPEKIRTVITKTVKAAETENCEVIEALVAEDYRDSFHRSKRTLMTRCRSQLSEPIIVKAIKRFVSLENDTSSATVVFTVRVVFEPQSYIHEFRSQMFFKLEATLNKQQADWLINRLEILQVDLTDANWKHIS